VDKRIVHRYTAAYPADTPLYNTGGNLYSNTPTHLAPFRARTVRTMHFTRLIPASLLAAPQFPLPSGLPPRTRRNMPWASIPFHVVFALQRTDMAPHGFYLFKAMPLHNVPESVSCPGITGEVQFRLLLHLGLQIPPSTQRASASDC